VKNDGPSDAVGVHVTDTLSDFIPADSYTIDDPTSGACTITPSELDCSLDIPEGESRVVTVTFKVAPFLSGDQVFTDTPNNGAEFRFVFDNGSVLQGNALGEVTLDGVPIDPHAGTQTKNDYLFDPPGVCNEDSSIRCEDDSDCDEGCHDGDAFVLHLSCSDAYTGGYSQLNAPAGPQEDDNAPWQIDYFSIARYKKTGDNDGTFFRACGNVVGDFMVDNEAFALGEDSFGDDDGDECPLEANPGGPNEENDGDPDDPECDSVHDGASVAITTGIEMNNFRKMNKHADVNLINHTKDDKLIRSLELRWPSANGNLRRVKLSGIVFWEGNVPGHAASATTRSVKLGELFLDNGESLPIDYDATPFIDDVLGRTLEADVIERMSTHFSSNADGGSYRMRLNFTDATFLDITIAGEGSDGDETSQAACGDGTCDAGETSCTCAADCGAPEAAVVVSGASVSTDGTESLILTFEAASGASGYNVYRSDDPALPQGSWTQVASNVGDMSTATPGVQWKEAPGEVASGAFWFYRVMALQECSP